MERPERPDDPDADEIARWMEEDFARAVAEGIEAAGEEEAEGEDDSES